MKVRVIHQRYGGPDDVAEDKLTGEPVSLRDMPLVNAHTDKPLVNGGSFAYLDPAVNRIRNWMPGEVLEMPDDEAEAQIKMTPLVLERESDHQARQQRIAARFQVRESARYEVDTALQQATQGTDASRRMAAMIAEKEQSRLREAGAALRPAPVDDKDKRIAELLRVADEQKAQIDKLMELVTRPAGEGAKA